MPTWLNWPNFGKLAVLLSGWIAFILTMRKAWFERTLLVFTVQATTVEADHDEQTDIYFDGTPIIRALSISITNNGLRPITIQEVECTFAFLTKTGERHEGRGQAWVNKKLSQGDDCFGMVKLYTKPTEIVAAWAVDSTHKKWPAASAKIAELNARGPEQWR